MNVKYVVIFEENPFVKSLDETIQQVTNFVNEHAYYLGMYNGFAL